MLQRVLENLVTNAIEAMDGAGTLTIQTRSEALRNNSSRVHVSVQDTGVGMPPEFVREHLFRPFATTKRVGLGLVCIGAVRSSPTVARSQVKATGRVPLFRWC